MGDDPALLGHKPVRTKLFFYADASEDRYAEAFLNVDPKTGMLEFHDKDSEYHRGIIGALTEPLPPDDTK